MTSRSDRPHDLIVFGATSFVGEILCRYLVFTYFDEPLQRACLAQMAACLRPQGLLILGKHEVLPDDSAGFMVLDEHNRIYCRVGEPESRRIGDA